MCVVCVCTVAFRKLVVVCGVGYNLVSGIRGYVRISTAFGVGGVGGGGGGLQLLGKDWSRDPSDSLASSSQSLVV